MLKNPKRTEETELTSDKNGFNDEDQRMELLTYKENLS
jgi:hypothetical protein